MCIFEDVNVSQKIQLNVTNLNQRTYSRKIHNGSTNMPFLEVRTKLIVYFFYIFTYVHVCTVGIELQRITFRPIVLSDSVSQIGEEK